MSKKLLSIMLLLIIPCSFVFSNYSTKFQIHAYKLEAENSAEQFVNLSITDAVVSDLDMINDGGTIILTDALDQLLGVVDKSTTDYTQRAAFSYRVTGNTVGTYTLKMEFDEPFYLYNNDIKDTRNRVDFRYDLGSITYSFNNYAEHKGTSFEDGNATYTLESPTSGENNFGGFESDKSDIKANPLVEKWTFSITGSDAKEMTFDSWIARGVVALTISEQDYNEVDIGTYKTNVRVTLTYSEGAGSST